MGKSKKGRPDSRKQAIRGKPIVNRRQHSQPGKVVKPARRGNSQHIKPRIPFTRNDSVLLVGEGDFSFALSLLKHHRPAVVVATSFDSLDTFLDKHPTSEQTVRSLDVNAIDGKISKEEVPNNNRRADEDQAWGGFSDASGSDEDDKESWISNDDCEPGSRCKVLFGIDATKLNTRHKKVLRPFSPLDKICFNFPHVGGLSTDVNRQVRANQQLLVGFFNSAKTMLSTTPVSSRYDGLDDHDADDESQQQAADLTGAAGRILVTLFEGEPYSLWNVRDLARHCGLQLIESFHFPWSAYPGYQHARTLGDLKEGTNRSMEGKRKGAWRGEDREARCYVFALKDDEGSNANNNNRMRKKRRRDDSSSSEEGS